MLYTFFLVRSASNQLSMALYLSLSVLAPCPLMHFNGHFSQQTTRHLNHCHLLHRFQESFATAIHSSELPIPVSVSRQSIGFLSLPLTESWRWGGGGRGGRAGVKV
ncbi:hypothetical protein E2C01_048682 [Portunus trituberculatus]|uniref:Uncharacterized protein n=1 Tax=Portunus trituberculatus TaxID=210409 RepID=A0A5B7GBM6_PORTR|nr:hypothetical protein [Portunus trituberculatus]